MSILEDAINKYGGADEAYKLKLKEHIRNGMGYSNYVAKANAAAGKPLSLNLEGNITPAGVKSLVGGAMNMRSSATENASDLAGAVDTAAGDLASAQAAREKKAAEDRKNNPLGFTSNDWLDKQIQEYAINRPKKEDGSYLSVDEFKSQLFGKVMGEGDASDTLFQPGLNEDVINKRIAERLPTDYQEKNAYYQALALGRTKNEAEELQAYEDYQSGKMSSGVKAMYDTLNPSWAKEAEVKKSEDSVKSMALQSRKDAQGNDLPIKQYSLEEIQTQNPNISSADVSKMVYTSRKPEIENKLRSEFINENSDDVRKAIKDDDYQTLFDTDNYKKIKKKILLENRGYLGADDVDSLLYEIVNNVGNIK